MRLSRAWPGVVCVAAMWVLVSAGPANADDCARLIKEKGRKAVLTNAQVIQDCLRTGANWGWILGTAVGGTGVLIGAGGLPLGGDTPQTPEDEQKEKACSELLDQYNQLNGEFKQDWSRLESGLQQLAGAKYNAMVSYMGREGLAAQRDEAYRYLAAAGLLGGTAAVVAAPAAVAAVGRVAATLRNAAAATGQAGQAIQGAATAVNAANKMRRATDVVQMAQAATQSAGWMSRISGALSSLWRGGKAAELTLDVVSAGELASAGITLGAAGAGAYTLAGGGAPPVSGSLLERLLGSGLEQFDNAMRNQFSMIHEWAQALGENKREALLKLDELQNLQARLQSECGIETPPLETTPLPSGDPAVGLGRWRWQDGTLQYEEPSAGSFVRG